MAGNMDPGAVKAAFVLNFARFTVWPDSAFSDTAAPIELRVYGNEKTREAFRNIDGMDVGTRKIHLKLMKSARSVDTCHIMFFDHDVDHKDLANALAAVQRQPVLTVGETQDFISLGGIINIFSRNERFQFEIVPSRASLWGLRISSRLLKLAIILED